MDFIRHLMDHMMKHEVIVFLWICLFLGSANNFFLRVLPFFLCTFCHTVNVWQQKSALFAQKQSQVTVTHSPYMAVKMTAKAITLHGDHKDTRFPLLVCLPRALSPLCGSFSWSKSWGKMSSSALWPKVTYLWYQERQNHPALDCHHLFETI